MGQRHHLPPCEHGEGTQASSVVSGHKGPLETAKETWHKPWVILQHGRHAAMTDSGWKVTVDSSCQDRTGWAAKVLMVVRKHASEEIRPKHLRQKVLESSQF